MYHTKNTQGKNSENKNQIDAREKTSYQKPKICSNANCRLHFNGSLKKASLKPILVFAFALFSNSAGVKSPL